MFLKYSHNPTEAEFTLSVEAADSETDTQVTAKTTVTGLAPSNGMIPAQLPDSIVIDEQWEPLGGEVEDESSEGEGESVEGDANSGQSQSAGVEHIQWSTNAPKGQIHVSFVKGEPGAYKVTMHAAEVSGGERTSGEGPVWVKVLSAKEMGEVTSGLTAVIYFPGYLGLPVLTFENDDGDTVMGDADAEGGATEVRVSQLSVDEDPRGSQAIAVGYRDGEFQVLTRTIQASEVKGGNRHPILSTTTLQFHDWPNLNKGNTLRAERKWTTDEDGDLMNVEPGARKGKAGKRAKGGRGAVPITDSGPYTEVDTNTESGTLRMTIAKVRGSNDIQFTLMTDGVTTGFGDAVEDPQPLRMVLSEAAMNAISSHSASPQWALMKQFDKAETEEVGLVTEESEPEGVRLVEEEEIKKIFG